MTDDLTMRPAHRERDRLAVVLNNGCSTRTLDRRCRP